MPDIPETWNKETEYILDFTKGYHNLLQREEDGNIQSYVWDSGALFMEEGEENYSYLNDLSGSVMRLSGNGRDSAAAYRYDEFGTDLSGNQGKFQPFGYTGYQRDAVAGTYYAQAREYDAGSGRFTSEDVVKGSAAYPETLNAYGYCWGNPVKYVDRDGREPQFVSGDDDYYTGDVEDGLPVVKKKEQYFVPADNYTHVGYDENGIPIIKKKNNTNPNTGKDTISNSKYLDESKIPEYLISGGEIANTGMEKFLVNGCKTAKRPNNIGAGQWNKIVTEDIDSITKTTSKIDGGLKTAGKLCTVATTGLEIYTDCKENKEKNAGWEEYTADIVVDLEFVVLGAAIGSIVPGAGTLVGAILGFVVGLLYFGATEVITYKEKSLKDWNKEGVKSTIEFLEEEIGGWVNGAECID